MNWLLLFYYFLYDFYQFMHLIKIGNKYSADSDLQPVLFA